MCRRHRPRYRSALGFLVVAGPILLALLALPFLLLLLLPGLALSLLVLLARLPLALLALLALTLLALLALLARLALALLRLLALVLAGITLVAHGLGSDAWVGNGCWLAAARLPATFVPRACRPAITLDRANHRT
jgi:hypothetical protein